MGGSKNLQKLPLKITLTLVSHDPTVFLSVTQSNRLISLRRFNRVAHLLKWWKVLKFRRHRSIL